MAMTAHKLFFQTLLRTRLSSSMTVLTTAPSPTPLIARSSSALLLTTTLHMLLQRSCIKTLCLTWIPQIYTERETQSWDEISESRDFRSDYKQWVHLTNSSAVLHGAHWCPELLLSWAVGLAENWMLHSLTFHPRLISNGNWGTQTTGKETSNMQLGYRPAVLREVGWSMSPYFRHYQPGYH